MTLSQQLKLQKLQSTQTRVKMLIEKPLTGEIYVEAELNGKCLTRYRCKTKPGYSHQINISAAVFIAANPKFGDLIQLNIEQPSTKRLK